MSEPTTAPDGREPPSLADPFRCSFCGKSQHEVKRLIAGPTGTFICNECTALCAEIVAEEEGASLAPKERLGGVDRAHVRLRAFEALEGWGTTDRITGKFTVWGFDVRTARAEELAEWALAEPLTISVAQTQAPAAPAP